MENDLSTRRFVQYEGLSFIPKAELLISSAPIKEAKITKNDSKSTVSGEEGGLPQEEKQKLLGIIFVVQFLHEARS